VSPVAAALDVRGPDAYPVDVNWSGARAPAAVGVLGLASCAYLYAADPSQPGQYPPCPTKVLSGVDCPFCGGLRATHELLHGNVLGALDFNSLAVLFILPVALVSTGLWALRSAGVQIRPVPLPRWAPTAAVVLMVVFTVVRNLPGMPLGTGA
jgi:hypothetical protein